MLLGIVEAVWPSVVTKILSLFLEHTVNLIVLFGFLFFLFLLFHFLMHVTLQA